MADTEESKESGALTDAMAQARRHREALGLTDDVIEPFRRAVEYARDHLPELLARRAYLDRLIPALRRLVTDGHESMRIQGKPPSEAQRRPRGRPRKVQAKTLYTVGKESL